MYQQDIPFLTTAKLAELIRAREVSPVEARLGVPRPY